MSFIYQRTNPYTAPQTYQLKQDDLIGVDAGFTLSGNIVDVEQQEIVGYIKSVQAKAKRLQCEAVEGLEQAKEMVEKKIGK